MSTDNSAVIARLERQRDELAEALRWYQEQVAKCRMLHKEGEDAREKLDMDGGARAEKPLANLANLDSDEDCRKAVMAGQCRYTVMGGDE